jgi:NADP-dependent 3-hydroxy acid dehydrogenase YdfG
MSSSPKIAIVTGAGGGIGECPAIALAKECHSVVRAGLRTEPFARRPIHGMTAIGVYFRSGLELN